MSKQEITKIVSLWQNGSFSFPIIKGRFLLFQVYRNFANLIFRLSVSTFYKQISKFQQTVQS